MNEYLSLIIGAVAGGVFFASTLVYMKRKSRKMEVEREQADLQMDMPFSEDLNRSRTLVSRR